MMLSSKQKHKKSRWLGAGVKLCLLGAIYATKISSDNFGNVWLRGCHFLPQSVVVTNYWEYPYHLIFSFETFVWGTFVMLPLTALSRGELGMYPAVSHSTAVHSFVETETHWFLVQSSQQFPTSLPKPRNYCACTEVLAETEVSSSPHWVIP